MSVASSKLYFLEFFKEKGFIRKRCPSCGRYFWTLNPDQQVCGDPPCGEYLFIGSPPAKVELTLDDVREKFLSFFERHGHKRVRRYPVVARWRDDVYLVGASIYDFQPWVTEGIVPPPANPLTISQPCIRLTDVDKVGKTGRHLTTFEMMAHHAFNFGKISTYWNEETVRYCFELLTQEYKIPEEEVTFIEDWWSGGGNAGEDFEVIVRGLEVATLVFMHYKTTPDGKPIPMNNYIVDTGYGLERIYWLLRGDPTVYHALYPELLDKLIKDAGLELPPPSLFMDISKLAGKFDIEKPEEERKAKQLIAEKHGLEIKELENILRPFEAIFRLLDHSKALMLMLGDGIVPSNTGEGYLARMLIRRCLRDIELLNLPISLVDVVEMQIARWSATFSELKQVRESILEMLKVEEERFRRTLQRGRELVKQKIREYRKKGVKAFSVDDLILLYDSHGIPPEIVAEEARKMGFEVQIPADFYSLLAKRHERAEVKEKKEKIPPEVQEKVQALPPTQLLFYEDSSLPEAKARVLEVLDNGRYIVLDKTVFYPEGGGAPADTGVIVAEGCTWKVVDVQKVGNVVVHICEPPAGNLQKGTEVLCKVDLKRRVKIVRAHTATHILLGAARRVLGSHVWQAGAQKGEDQARLDITHFRHLSLKEIEEIEKLANQVIRENRKVTVQYLDRNTAEAKYGFTLYQGGVVPEKTIRVVDIEGWDAEACCGIHCNTTGEVGLIKIVRWERIQDGVERLIYYVGDRALEYYQELFSKSRKMAELLGTQAERVDQAVEELYEELKELRARYDRVKRKLMEYEATRIAELAESVGAFKLYVTRLEEWTLDEARDLGLIAVEKEPSLVFFAGRVSENAVDYVIVVGEQLLNLKIDAPAIVRKLKEHIKIVGGGKAKVARGRVFTAKLDGIKSSLKCVLEKLGQ